MTQRNDYTGQQIHHYQMTARIGGGGQGVVYRAEDQKHGREVAIKVIRPGDMQDAEAVKRFQMEAAITFRLKHPCIVPIYDYWTDERGVWMVMRWFEGGSLRGKIEQGRLTLAQVTTLLARIAQAVDAAHKINVIHRDIKPDNILFDAEDQAYLSDFGAAKRMNAERITKTGTVVGSPGYYAPEILRKEAITPRVDIFALGIVLYEAFSGVHPYHSGSLLQMVINILQKPLPDVRGLRPDLPEAVTGILQKATDRDPAARYETAGALAAALAALVTP